MEDPRLLVKRSRDALARTEAAFSKVQSIGKAGNDRCTKLTDKLAVFSASYESCREEVNAALALVEAQGAGASNGSTSHNDHHGGTGTDSTAEVSVHEAMELEAAAAHELKHARDANLDFQRQRKAVRDLVVDAWDQLVAIAKSVEEADKLALRALSEWDAGDEKKAVKYADKASRKADRSYKSAIETERALANIMAGLKEGRTALHAAESHLSSGSVKAEQARSVALGAWEALGLLPPPSPHAARQKPFNEHSSRNRERRPKSASPDRCDPVSTHSSVRASKPSSRSNPQSTATESPASGSSAGHSGSSHAHSSSNYDSDSGSQLQRTREAVNVMRPAALENDHSPWPSRNPSGSHGKSNYRSPVDLEWDAAFEKEAVALKEARELAQDEVALAELRRQRAALDSSFGANEVARQAANGLANHISSGRSNSSSTGGGDFSDTGSQHSRTSSGHGSGTSSSRSEKRAYKSKSVAAMVTSLASREAKLEQKVLDRKAANRARFLAAAVARTKAQASATAAAAGAVNVTSPQSADTLESNLSSNNNNNGNNGSRRPFIPSPAARDDAESQALAAHYFGLAGELEDEDHLAEAADAYAASLQHQPAQAEGHYNLAIILDALGRFDESVSSSLSALALNPQWPEAHYNLGQTYDSIGDIRRAVACYEAAVALKPEWDDAVHNLAVAKHELAAQPELEPLEPQQQQQQHELRPPSTPERSTQAHSSNRFISPTTPGPSSSTPVAYTTPQPLPPGVLGGANSSMGSGNTSGAQQLFSSPSSTSSPAPPPMYTPFGSTQYSNSNTNASSALFNSAGAFYDNHSDDDSENPDEGGWDLESATSSKSGTASDAGSQHSDVSFWSAASHASKATSHRSSSNKHSHGRSVSIGRHGSSPLPAMPPTPPRDQPTGRGFSASYDEAGDLQRRNSALGAALDEASENDDDNPMPDKKNCLLS